MTYTVEYAFDWFGEVRERFHVEADNAQDAPEVARKQMLAGPAYTPAYVASAVLLGVKEE